ncbi:MAG: FAD-dependent monooxygenase [Pseudomonadota bacterium]
MFEVVIIGAGPAGLTLGAELSANGVNCLILEKRVERSNQSRAFSLTPHTLELLETRGIAEIFLRQGVKCEFAPLGDGKNMLSFRRLKTRFPYLLSISQDKTEHILEEWAAQCGVNIMYGAELIDLYQNKNQVDIIYRHESQLQHIQADYVIGCDGVSGKVSNLADIAVTKIQYKHSLMHGDVKLKNPPEANVFAKTSRRGMVAIFPVTQDVYRVLALDQERMHVPIHKQVTLKEFKTSVKALSNRDFEINSPLWLNRFRCQQRHAVTYRKGRIFLAGDAAHTQLPAGGQGLQISIQDGFNLGWKLAAVIKNGAATALLDTYESERRPLIYKAMRRSIIMYRYEIAQDKLSRILKWTANKLLNISFMQNYVVRELAGLTIKYPTTQKMLFLNKNITGSKITNLELIDTNGHREDLFAKMKNYKFFLIGNSYNKQIENYIKSHWEEKITYVHAPNLKNEYGVNLCLLRPDSFIAWAAKSIQLTYLDKALKYHV